MRSRYGYSNSIEKLFIVGTMHNRETSRKLKGGLTYFNTFTVVAFDWAASVFRMMIMSMNAEKE